MSIMDALLIFDEKRPIEAVGSAPSTNIIDLGAGRDAFDNAIPADPGESGRPWLNVAVVETFVGAANASLKVTLSDAESAQGPYQVEIESAAIAQPDLTAGRRLLRIPLPADCRRFLQLIYTVAEAPFTAGKVTSWIGLDSETPR